MKRIWLSFCIATLIPVVTQAAVEKRWWGNWLVGVSAGLGDRSGIMQTRISYANLPQLGEIEKLRNISDVDWIMGALVGYQAVYQKWLIGGELNLDQTPHGKNHNFAFSGPGNTIGWQGEARYRNKGVAGLTGRMGYAIRPYFMPYLRLGVAFSRPTWNIDFSNAPFPMGTTLNTRHWVHSFLWGFGAEIPLPQLCQTTLRMEYHYYSKGQTLKINETNLDGNIYPIFESGLQPKTKVGKLSLVWNFF